MSPKSSALAVKLEVLRAQRVLLQQEVAALSSKDRELARSLGFAEQQPAQSQSFSDSLHMSQSQSPSPQPSAYLQTPIAQRIEAGLRALCEPSPWPLHSATLGVSTQNIQQTPEQSSMPRQLSVEEMKDIIANAMSPLNSRPHEYPQSTISPPDVGQFVSQAHMSSGPQSPHSSRPPRPKSSAEESTCLKSPYLKERQHQGLADMKEQIEELQKRVTVAEQHELQLQNLLRQEGEQNAELKHQLAALQKANAMLEEERAMVEEEKRSRVEEEKRNRQLRHSVSTDMGLAAKSMERDLRQQIIAVKWQLVEATRRAAIAEATLARNGLSSFETAESA